MDTVLKTNEAAKYLGIHRDTLIRYVKKNMIKCFRTPGNQMRFWKSELDNYSYGVKDGNRCEEDIRT